MVRALLDFAGLLKASRRSLKTKIIVVTLAIFVAGIWSLTFYATRNLRSDMVHLLGEQQFSTVTLVANQVNHELADRIRSLEEVAYQARPAMQAGPAAMQAHLARSNELYRRIEEANDRPR